MKFYKYLYIGEKIKNPGKVKRKLKKHEGQFVYVICFPKGSDHLEFFQSAYLKQKYYRYYPPVVIGIANDYDEAVKMVIQIITECREATGDFHVKDYLNWKVRNSRSKKGIC